VTPAQPATSRKPKHTPIATPIADALTQRAEALLRADRAALLAVAAAFEHASDSYQRARTLILAAGGQRATGEGELARMGATPMAAYR